MSPPGLFITGTNTEVGKTYVAAMIARDLAASGLRVGIYKPAASGCVQRDGELVSDDALALWEAAGQPGRLEDVCPQRFAAAVAPHLAARAESREIDSQLLLDGLKRWQECSDVVLVEGAGGLMSPLGDDQYVADLAYDMGFPLVVVAANELGVINQTLQTLITAATFREGLDVAGVVLNDCRRVPNDSSTHSNLHELRTRCVSTLLAHVSWQAKTFAPTVDWASLARGS